MEQQEAFLRRECSDDPAAQAEVRKLLGVALQAPDFLQNPVMRISGSPFEPPAFEKLLPPGETLNGRYIIEDKIGEGGFSTVYLAADAQLPGKKVVAKVIRGDIDDQWLLRRLDREIKALSRIDHPGVVSVLDHGNSSAGPYVVTQYVPGRSLRALLMEEPGPWPFRRVLHLISQIARALAAAHQQGICHRDLRPENIIVRDAGRPYEQAVVIDFGIATIRDSAATTGTSTQVAGSPEYMAPEQFLGRPQPASDVYALGAIAFEMLTGQQLHIHNSPKGLKATGDVYPPEVPLHAQKAIARAIHYDYHSRYENVEEFAQGLSSADLMEQSDRQTIREKAVPVESQDSDEANPVARSATDTDSFTRMFQDQRQPAATPGHPPHPRPTGASEPKPETGDSGSFTKVFGGRPPTGPPAVIPSPPPPSPITSEPLKTDPKKAELPPLPPPDDESFSPLFKSPAKSSRTRSPESGRGTQPVTDDDRTIFRHVPSPARGDATDILRSPPRMPGRDVVEHDDYTRARDTGEVRPLPIPQQQQATAPKPTAANGRFVVALPILIALTLLAIAIAAFIIVTNR